MVKINQKNIKNMETIILVSVLSTLGIVSVVLSVVVMFFKLKDKVDVTGYQNDYKSLNDYIDHVVRTNKDSITEVNNRISRVQEELGRDISESNRNLFGHIDSRCDKIDSKITKNHSSK